MDGKYISVANGASAVMYARIQSKIKLEDLSIFIVSGRFAGVPARHWCQPLARAWYGEPVRTRRLAPGATRYSTGWRNGFVEAIARAPTVAPRGVCFGREMGGAENVRLLKEGGL